MSIEQQIIELKKRIKMCEMIIKESELVIEQLEFDLEDEMFNK